MTIICEEIGATLEVSMTETLGKMCDMASVITLLLGGDTEGAECVADSLYCCLIESIAEVTDKTPEDVYQDIRKELIEEENEG